ncbi:hypothetical protein OTU49_001615, partial [Cherax quadricarinatus]
VVRIPETSEATFSKMTQFGKTMGKVIVQCKDTPGFIANHLIVPYLLAAIRLVERGDGTMEDVDTAMKLGAGYPMGPFEVLDHIGVDLFKSISEDWSTRFPEEQAYRVPSTLVKKVEEGKLGRKTGEGFYKYN